MNKKIGILFILIIVIAFLIYFNIKQIGLNNEQIFEIVKEDIYVYCEQLEKEASSSCAQCRFYYPLEKDSEFGLVDNIKNEVADKHVYTIKKQENNYLVTIRMNVYYGVSTRTGNLDLGIVLDEKGKIISKDFPEDVCV